MYNKATLIGRLGADPETKYTQSGTPVATFNLATSETWVKDGEKQEKTEWHRIVAWGNLAEICGKHLTKGKLILIDGKLQTRSWEDQEGNKRQVTEIVAQGMKMLEFGNGNKPNKTSVDSSLIPEDDIPF
ncbi:MAG: single-stranded DNA-binding protein [Deltaproteobacteria bacterium]|nr:single-stranded DNA-binding protein [Deltaproteobacteria bacterium]